MKRKVRKRKKRRKIVIIFILFSVLYCTQCCIIPHYTIHFHLFEWQRLQDAEDDEMKTETKTSCLASVNGDEMSMLYLYMRKNKSLSQSIKPHSSTYVDITCMYVCTSELRRWLWWLHAWGDDWLIHWCTVHIKPRKVQFRRNKLLSKDKEYYWCYNTIFIYPQTYIMYAIRCHMQHKSFMCENLKGKRGLNRSNPEEIVWII